MYIEILRGTVAKRQTVRAGELLEVGPDEGKQLLLLRKAREISAEEYEARRKPKGKKSATAKQ